jgi:Methyl-accepting chemotaxis protein (MCP) signalling domain
MSVATIICTTGKRPDFCEIATAPSLSFRHFLTWMEECRFSENSKKNPTLAMKIGLAFGMLIVLTMAVSFFFWRGLSILDLGLGEFRGIAQQTKSVGHIQANMLTAQINAKDFPASGGESSVNCYKELLEKCKGFIAEANMAVTKSEMLEKITSTEEMIAAFDAGFAKLVTLRAERNKLIGDLGKLGYAMEQNLTDLMEKATKSGVTHTRHTAGVSIRILLLGRLHLSRLLETNLPADAINRSFLKTQDELSPQLADVSSQATVTEISEQTNLLALNATIEAARADEAWQGFCRYRQRNKGTDQAGSGGRRDRRQCSSSVWASGKSMRTWPRARWSTRSPGGSPISTFSQAKLKPAAPRCSTAPLRFPNSRLSCAAWSIAFGRGKPSSPRGEVEQLLSSSQCPASGQNTGRPVMVSFSRAKP